MSFWSRLTILSVLFAACAATSSNPARGITEIHLQRDCTGCPHGTTLILTRDGHATRTESGNARFGTADSVSVGTLSVADFDALAGVIIRHHFFDLEPVYGDPQIQDSPWRSMT